MLRFKLHSAAIGLLVVTAGGCTSKREDRRSHDAATQQEDGPAAGTLAVGNAIADELGVKLLAAGLTQAQAQVITDGGRNEMAATAGAVTIQALRLAGETPIAVVAPPLVRGAVRSLAAAGLPDMTKRAAIAGVIMDSTVGSLGGRTTDLTQDAIYSLQGRMIGESITSLNDAGLGDAAAPLALSAITSSSVGALTRAGIAEADAPAAATALAAAAVKSLAGAKLPADLVKDLLSSTVAGTVGGLGALHLPEPAAATGAIAQAAVTSLASMGLAKDKLLLATEGAAFGAVSALATAGVAQTAMADAGKLVAKSAVEALKPAGYEAADVGVGAGAVAAGAINGLGKSGMSSELILSSKSVAAVVEGATGALSSAALSADQIGPAMGDVAGGAVGALAGLGLATSAQKQQAAADVSTGGVASMKAVGLKDVGAIGAALSNMSQKSVGALGTGGFTAAEMGGASAAMTQASIAGIAGVGLTNPSDVIEASSKVAMGTMMGGAQLAKAGLIDEAQTKGMANAVSASTLDGFASLQQAGLVNSASDLASFTGAMAQSTLSGMAIGGMSSASVAGAEAGVQQSLTSTAGMAKVGATANTQQQVSSTVTTLTQTAVTFAQQVGDGTLAQCAVVYADTLADADMQTKVASLPLPQYCAKDVAALCPRMRTTSGWQISWMPTSPTVCSLSYSVLATVGMTVISAPSPFAITMPMTPVANTATPVVMWGPATGAVSYDLRVGTSPDCSVTVQTQLALTTNQATLAALADGLYYLCVLARDAQGNVSAAANSGRTMTVDATAPTQPFVSGVATTATNTPSWTWVAGGGGSGQFRFGLDTPSLIAQLPSSQTSYVPILPLSDGPHTLYVEEQDANGNWSATGSYTTVVDTTGPTAATSLKTTTGSASNAQQNATNLTSLYFVWTPGTDPSGVRDYTVTKYAAASCAGAGTTLTTGLTASSYVFTGAVSGTTSFKVRSYDNLGNSTVSACSPSITVDSVPPPPLTAFIGTTGTTAGDIQLGWTNPGDLSDYSLLQIRRAAGATPPVDCLTGVGVTTVTNFATVAYVDAGLTPGSYYSYRVCISDPAGNATSSNTVANVQAKPYEHRIFVSTVTFDGNLTTPYGGHSASFRTVFEGADYRCNDLATTAGLSGKWRALISDGTTDPKARVALKGNVVNTSGQLVATTAAQFWSGTLTNSFAFNETAGATTGFARMNVTTGGVKNSVHCLNGRAGLSNETGSRVTVTSLTPFASATSGACNVALPLVCMSVVEPLPPLVAFSAAKGAASGDVDLTVQFGNTSRYDHVDIRKIAAPGVPHADCATDGTVATTISAPFTDRTVTLATGTPGGHVSYRACIYDNDGIFTASQVIEGAVAQGSEHRIFTTTSVVTGNMGGLVAADATCATAAAAGALTGTWKAVMSSSTVPASTRVVISGPVYNMADQLVAANSAAFYASTLAAPAYFSETGTSLLQSTGVWTGATSTGGIASALHCTDWTSTGGTGEIGNASGTPVWLGNSTLACSTSLHLLCVSQ